VLEAGKLASTVSIEEKEKDILKSFHLLTAKPFLYVLNRKNGVVNIDIEAGSRWDDLMRFFAETHASYVIVDANTEKELTDVHEEEKMDFRRELGVTDDGLDMLIKKSYETLNLISFFTTGEKETRAWTIVRGSTAPVAGAAIHSDFRDKFIRATVISSDKLLEAGGYPAAREKGWVRTEGKEYVVQDGDVMEFMHS
jgi:ribosome-binding ATPase YchF (GTP1/OBG family)